MQIFNVENHEPSLLPDGYDFQLVWADEFDGTELDTTKWGYRLHMMGKRHRTWGEEGVHLDGESHAVFTCYEKDGEICSSQLQTGSNYMDIRNPNWNEEDVCWPLGKLEPHRFVKKYGYFECRCRLQQKKGWWSAFWLQSPIIGSSLDPAISGIENDCMESFAPGNVSLHSNHYNGYGPNHKCEEIGKGADVDPTIYHTFGVLWTPEGYTYYIDGVEDGRSSGPVSHTPQFILISTEVQGYRRRGFNRAAEEAKEAIGDTFVVDYVRVFDFEKK